MTTSAPVVRLSAADIAEVLEQHTPTPEQAAVIESSARSCLVVAGAGSGKTETMAGRVVWLVANGIVRPEQVLGLTFTRKAAAELAGRIRRRLAELARRGVVESSVVDAGEPTVSTYDSYAGRIVAEHALRLGREPGQRLIAQTVAWQYARRAVDTYAGDMDHVHVQPSTVTAEVLALAEGMVQHGTSADDVRSLCLKYAAVLDALPPGEEPIDAKRRMGLRDIAATLQARCQLLPIVEAYRDNKRRGEALDFADQMALAAELAGGFPEVAAAERATYRAVLLDEYQDTSHAQLAFLRALFGPALQASAPPLLTAVGDPSQAIYGWRGASQGTLAAFPTHFPDAARPAPVLNLGTSFRNEDGILAVANAIAAPLRAGAAVATPVLQARAEAGCGVVRCGLYDTVDDEAEAIADLVAAEWQSGAAGRAGRESREGQDRRSVAVLVRAWSQLPRIEAALRRREVPLQILGVGGLLLEPEVVDVVATLRVLVDPVRGDALMRLLTGARWRIGPRDLAALGRWARQLARPLDQADPTAEPDEVDNRSIIDALDAVDAWPPTDRLSAAGYERLRALSRELRALRSRLAQPLPDLVADVIRTTGLDVEVLAHVDVAGAAASGSVGRANLDALLDVAADFAAGGEDPSVPAFLDYLDAAATQERGLDRPDDDTPSAEVPESMHGLDVQPDRVQLLTVHRAKGLEWDVVCVPGLVDKLFPNVNPREGKGWLTQRGELPWPLRGDRSALPTAMLDVAPDQTQAVAALERFKADVEDHLRAEERRLAYVAVTRARHTLMCTGFRWDDTKNPRQPSDFLSAVRAVCEGGVGTVEVWAAQPDDGVPNPRHAGGKRRAAWPIDPLGSRRATLDDAARLVEAMAAELGDVPAAELFGEQHTDVANAMREWERDIEVLLAEREARAGSGRADVVMPSHLSVSQLVTLRRDPDELARQLRRPVPTPPAPLARRGTAFHAWLEQRFGSPRLLDIDELPGAADADAASDADLALLQAAFLASPWAERDPIDVEVPFELVLGAPPVVVRGRMDAVFADDDGGFTIVDWKTGRRPTGADASAAAVQLAAYRLAWADLTGADLERIRAVFVYLRFADSPSGADYAPSDLLDRGGLVELLRLRDST